MICNINYQVTIILMIGNGKFISFVTGPAVIYEGSWKDGVKVWF